MGDGQEGGTCGPGRATKQTDASASHRLLQTNLKKVLPQSAHTSEPWEDISDHRARSHPSAFTSPHSASERVPFFPTSFPLLLSRKMPELPELRHAARVVNKHGGKLFVSYRKVLICFGSVEGKEAGTPKFPDHSYISGPFFSPLQSEISRNEVLQIPFPRFHLSAKARYVCFSVLCCMWAVPFLSWLRCDHKLENVSPLMQRQGADGHVHACPRAERVTGTHRESFDAHANQACHGHRERDACVERCR